MSAQAIQKKRDMDTLHVLPLSIIPLKTAGLKRARLVKNAQMEGMIELFSSDRGGSGQIAPKHLDRVFQFDETNFRDQVIVTKLADLPSYDVYSLEQAFPARARHRRRRREEPAASRTGQKILNQIHPHNP